MARRADAVTEFAAPATAEQPGSAAATVLIAGLAQTEWRPILTLLAEEYGYRTLFADSTDAATRTLAEYQVDLVIAEDGDIDGLDGRHILAGLRISQPHTVRVMALDRTAKPPAKALASLAVYQFVRKPLDGLQIGLLVKRALESRELARRHRLLSREFKLRSDNATSSLHEDDLQRYAAARDAAIRSRRDFAIDVRRVAADGTVRWEHLIGQPQFGPDGNPTDILSLVRDITEAKQAEELLRQSEERFRALIEHSSDMVAVLNPSGRATYRSPSWGVALGYTAETLRDKPILDLVHPDDVADFYETLIGLLGDPGGSATGHSRLRHEDGSWRNVAWTGRNALGVAGVEGLILNGRDVTGERQLEEQLQQARKLEAVGQLAGGIAHDFNNILGIILGFAEFLKEDLQPASMEQGYAERIALAAKRGRDLVRQILAFARKSAVERTPTDLVQIVHEAHDLLRASLPPTTEFILKEADGPLIAEVNGSQISQIIVNLCVNANDALLGHPGQVTIGVDRAPSDDPAFDLGVSSRGENSVGLLTTGTLDRALAYARIIVTDSGNGIDSEILPQIFDPFFTTKRRDRGTGLGLAVVHGYVLAYDGVCLVESQLGSGSKFTIYLPVSERPVSIATERGSPGSRGNEHILVVDDEPLLTEILQIRLSRLGYSVTTEDDPSHAWSRFKTDSDRFDLVVSDHMMPKLTGLSLLKRMRALRPSIRFILCTGQGDIVTEQDATAAGVDGFFIKPVAPERLAGAIRNLLDKPLDLGHAQNGPSAPP